VSHLIPPSLTVRGRIGGKIRGLVSAWEALVTESTSSSAPLPSLDAVRAELDIERSAQEKRNDTLDSRAGTALGFSGVLAGLALNSKSLWALPGALVAAAAAVVAASVVWPRMHNTIKPRALHGHYLARPLDETKRKLLDTRIVDYEKNQEQLKLKTERLRLSIKLLTAAVGLVVVALVAALIVSSMQ
jgi:hypothetical protein